MFFFCLLFNDTTIVTKEIHSIHSSARKKSAKTPRWSASRIQTKQTSALFDIYIHWARQTCLKHCLVERALNSGITYQTFNDVKTSSSCLSHLFDLNDTIKQTHSNVEMFWWYISVLALLGPLIFIKLEIFMLPYSIFSISYFMLFYPNRPFCQSAKLESKEQIYFLVNISNRWMVQYSHWFLKVPYDAEITSIFSNNNMYFYISAISLARNNKSLSFTSFTLLRL